MAIALAALAAASCEPQMRDMTGFDAIGASARQVTVFEEHDATEARDLDNLRQREILLQMRGPSAFTQHKRDDTVLCAELRWRGGAWLGCVATRHTPAAGLSGVCNYEISFVLDKHDAQDIHYEPDFRAALEAGHELQARLVIGREGRTDASSEWVSFARNQDALRQSLAKLRRS